MAKQSEWQPKPLTCCQHVGAITSPKACKSQPLKFNSKARNTSIYGSITCSYPGTTVSKSLIHNNLQSWQAHLKQNSTYLCRWQIWWDSDENRYTFHAGAHHPDYHPEGQPLRHFRQSTIQQVAQEEEVWQMMIDAKTDLPIPLLRLYNSDGSLAGTREFTNTQQSAPIPVPVRSHSNLPLH